MKKIFLLLMLCFLNSCGITEKKVTLLAIGSHILQEDPTFAAALKEVYDDSFNAIYGKNNWKDYFDHYMNQFKTSDDMILIVALQDDVMVGWILFKYHERSAIIEILCIDSHYWRQGIGKKLVSAIKEQLPEINHIAVVTRKINGISPFFYESLGFKKTGFSLPEYHDVTGQLQGYEWHQNIL